MQQPPQMIPVMPSFPPTSITTEQIQKYLDENKKLIVAILDNQNLGKLAECAQHIRYQAQLQKNLMYLAAIADAQPQVTTMPSQFSLGQLTPHAAMQQGAYFMQHPQATAMAQQQGIFPQKMPLQFNNPHQMQEQQLLHQQAVQGQMGMRPGGMHNGPRSDSGLGAGSGGPPSVTADLNDGCGGSKQDGSEAGPTGGDRPGGTNISHGGRDGESLCTKGPKKGK